MIGLSNKFSGSFEQKAIGMAAALLMLSFATVLYTIVIFKLLSFFIMPSLFFDLLFIGFPIGAMIGAFFFKVNVRSFVWTIGILQLALLVSTYAVLFAHNFSYLRIHLFNAEIKQLIVNIAIFASLFLPFFIAYGLCEYIGYQIGRKRFKARMHAVYAIYLFGAAAAYLLAHWLVPLLGVTKLILSAFLIMALVGMFISAGKSRFVFIVQMAFGVYCMFLPNLESNFLRMYKGATTGSTAFYEVKQFTPAFQKWGRYSLNEILESPDSTAYYGFYNDFLQWEYYPERGYNKPSLGTIPLLMSPANSKKLIIGSGGGRQVRFATVTGHKNITAVELEPAVIEAVRGEEHLLEDFQYVYDQPEVRIIQSEGRKYLERLQEKQDLIYLPSVGGYPQMMLEPGNLIRTYEAYELAAKKLSENGIFAIWYPSGLDPKGVLTDQYVSTLRTLGLKVKAYRNNEEFLILSKHKHADPLPTAEVVMDLLIGDYRNAGGSKNTFPISMIPVEYLVTEDMEFQPVTDNQPYLGGNVRHVFSTNQVYQLYGFGGIVLLLLGLVIYFSLRKIGNPNIHGRSFNSVAVLALLLGTNFLLVEHHLVFVLFKINYVFHDALMLGAVVFLILSGIGSVITNVKIRSMIIRVALGCYITLMLTHTLLPDWILLGLMLPVVVVSGTFFPLLFEKAAKNPLGVFALDAIGAGLGSLLAAAIPILMGFQVYSYIALIIFSGTILMDHWFHRSETNSSMSAIS